MKAPTQKEIEAMAKEYVEAYGIPYEKALDILQKFVADTKKELKIK